MLDLKPHCEAYTKEAETLMNLVAKVRSMNDRYSHRLKWDLNREACDDITARLRRFRRADCNPRYRIAMAGGYSVGKSYSINSVLNAHLLPTEMEESTFVPTYVRLPEDGKMSVNVQFMTQGEVADFLAFSRSRNPGVEWPSTAEMASQCTSAEIERMTQTLSKRSKEDLPKFFQALSSPEIFERILPGDQSHSERIDLAEVPDYVRRHSDRIERYLLRSATIQFPGFPKELGTGVELVDLPGTDADDEWAKQITLRHSREMDAMLLVVNAERPFTDSESELLDSMKEWSGTIGDRLFIVANRADTFADKPADQIIGVYNQLRNGLARAFPGNQFRIFYCSALAKLGKTPAEQEQAREATKRIPKTGVAALDEALSKVVDEGGFPYLLSEMHRFLETRATDTKLEAMQRVWRPLLDRITVPVLAKSHEFGDALDGGKEKTAARANSMLEKAREAVELSCADLRRDAARVADRLVERDEATLIQQLKDAADAICESAKSVPPQEGNEDAVVIARKRFAEIHHQFRRKAFECMRELLLRPFFEKCDKDLTVHLSLLASISIPEENLPPVSRGVSDAMIDSLQLRLAETMRDPEKLQPYRDPPNQPFKSFLADFLKEVRGYLQRQIPKVVEQLRDYLRLHLEWHLAGANTRVRLFVSFVTARNLTMKYPDRFGSLTAGSEDRELLQLARELKELAAIAGAIAIDPPKKKR